MNNILRLKGKFNSASATFAGGGHPCLPAKQHVDAAHLVDIASSLETVETFWSTSRLDIDPLVCVFYDRIVAKSNRIQRLLAPSSGKASRRIVGARYDVASDLRRSHVITYRVPTGEVSATRSLLYKSAEYLKAHYNEGRIGNDELDRLFENGPETIEGVGSRRLFAQVIKDAFYVRRFGTPDNMADDTNETAFVTLYDTGRDTYELLREAGIDDLSRSRVLENSVLLTRGQYERLRNRAPYLVAMELEDANDWGGADFGISAGVFPPIPSPTNEPVIGVIDTPFSEATYFHEWVEYHDCLAEGIVPRDDDYAHGTAVSSIIVDGPALNPDLEDGCGRFRVRHFGVALSGPFSSFDIMRKVREIVASNPEIKVWNLSLGSVLEIQENSISPEADILDRIQTEYDVVFVVAGTNRDQTRQQERIGAPADSINSLVVNSVDADGCIVDYARRGPVLSFFGKPDVSYYGGTSANPTTVAGTYATFKSSGTSLAAPWIARKMAFLIHKAGMTRELAKALIIDSAIGWGTGLSDCRLGYGVVPKDIRSVLQCRNDEIRFVINGVADSYSTYNYRLPIPMRNDRFPYLARATLCYFPKCDRNQGVDYTGVEMDLKLGRLKDDGIKAINGDLQGVIGARLNEDDARNYFRKWDNVKHVADTYTPKARPRKTYVAGSNLWGLKIITTDRAVTPTLKHQPFGLVVTLREMNGVNRIDEFMQQCMGQRWMVDPIDIDQLVDIYKTAESDIEFED